MSDYEITSLDAPNLKARVDGEPIAEFFLMKNFRFKVEIELPPSGSPEQAFQDAGEGWIRVRDFVSDNVDAVQYEWAFHHRTIAFYFTDQLTAAKARLLV